MSAVPATRDREVSPEFRLRPSLSAHPGAERAEL